MDCSDLDRFLNNEMTKEEQEIFREHTEQCKVCKIQTEFYNSLKINKIPQLPENFEVSVMTKIHNKPKFYGFAIFALFLNPAIPCGTRICVFLPYLRE